MFGLFGKKEGAQIDYTSFEQSVELNKIDSLQVRKALQTLDQALKASSVPVDGEYKLEAFGKQYTLCYIEGQCTVKM